MENEETKTEKKLDEDLNKILSENDLQSYTDILVKEKLYSINDLKELTQDDYKELGITALGDRKRFIKLFSEQTENLPEIQQTQITETKSEKENSNQQDESKKPETVIINNTTGSSAHTGIAGVIGGILGAVAVIAIGLIILSNESFQL